MWWRSKLQRFQQKSKTICSGFLINPQQFKHPGLFLAIMNTNRAATCFVTIDNEVIGNGSGFTWGATLIDW